MLTNKGDSPVIADAYNSAPVGMLALDFTSPEVDRCSGGARARLFVDSTAAS